MPKRAKDDDQQRKEEPKKKRAGEASGQLTLADFARLLEPMRADIDKKFGEVQEDIDKKFGEVRADIAGMRTDIDKKFGEVRAELGRHNELLLRPHVAEMFGRSAAKQYTIKSLLNLAALASTDLLESSPAGDDPDAKAEMRQRNARTLAQELKSHVGDFVRNFFGQHSKKLRNLAEKKWTAEDMQKAQRLEGRPGQTKLEQLATKLKRVLSSVPSGPLKKEKVISFCDAAVQVLRRPDAAQEFHRDGSTDPEEYLCSAASSIFTAIAEYFKLDEKGKTEAFIRCGGLGIPVATWVTAEHMLFEVEIDVRGGLNVMKVGDSQGVSVMVGEIKGGPEGVKHAAEQLTRSASLISWAVRTLYSDIDVHSICRIFIPKSGSQHYQKPVDKPNMSFVVHGL